MAVLFVPGSEDASEWVPALAAALPGIPVHTVDDAFDPASIEVAIVAPSAGEALRGLPALRLVQSLWMGVDRLLAEGSAVPPGVPIARMVDPGMTTQMPEAALTHVLHLHRAHDRYARQQRLGEWRQWPQPPASRRSVGVLGLGELGARTAALLAAHGFRVHGWSRTPRRLEGVETHTELEAVLAASEIVVNLLPLTASTRGLLDARRFARMPSGACLVNLARGAHVVEDDLRAALDPRPPAPRDPRRLRHRAAPARASLLEPSGGHRPPPRRRRLDARDVPRRRGREHPPTARGRAAAAPRRPRGRVLSDEFSARRRSCGHDDPHAVRSRR
jgi:glyoxylate/hydroxypyruvate reductase